MSTNKMDLSEDSNSLPGPLNLSTINPGILHADYAIRGKLPELAAKIRADIASGSHRWPFSRVVSLNLGNPQGCGQMPLTFPRQVVSLMQYPKLIQLSKTHTGAQLLSQSYPSDAISRAESLLQSTGSVGAYSSNYGYPCVRESVAAYIQARDGFPSSPDDIFLTCGAFEGMLVAMTLLSGSHMRPAAAAGGQKTGVLLPVPFYPVYRALLITLDITPIFYHLDEDNGWRVPPAATLNRIIDDAIDTGIIPRCLVIINPSNPTGAVISQSDLTTLVRLAADRNLLLVADEVYQENLFPPCTFTSVKATVRRLQQHSHHSTTLAAPLQLISLHSISKGMLGEGGQRGGYFEAVGFPPAIHDQIRKFITYTLQPASMGQILVDLMVRPPKDGDASFATDRAEKEAVYARLQRNASALDEAFARMPDVRCARAQGAIYHFPRVELSPMALSAARKEGEAPDVWYCRQLLEATGVCVVPGSGFGMGDGSRDGRIWYRISFLDDGLEWVEAMGRFQDEFVKRFWDKS